MHCLTHRRPQRMFGEIRQKTQQQDEPLKQPKGTTKRTGKYDKTGHLVVPCHNKGGPFVKQESLGTSTKVPRKQQKDPTT